MSSLTWSLDGSCAEAGTAIATATAAAQNVGVFLTSASKKSATNCESINVIDVNVMDAGGPGDPRRAGRGAPRVWSAARR